MVKQEMARVNIDTLGISKLNGLEWVNLTHMTNVDLEKAEEPEIKLLTTVGSSKRQESPRKNIYFCFIDYAKPLTVWMTTDCGKLFKR